MAVINLLAMQWLLKPSLNIDYETSTMKHQLETSTMKHSLHHYDYVSIVLHWLMGFGLIAVYFLGLYMVKLDYYDAWYNQAPALHISIGLLLSVLLVIRIVWVYSQLNSAHIKPRPTEPKKALQLLAKLAHLCLYLITLLLMISGYLITTPQGQGIGLFNIIEIPASYSVNAEQSEFLGTAHDILASLFIMMVSLHTIAALWHHFIFKDNTLKRMLWAHKQHNKH